MRLLVRTITRSVVALAGLGLVASGGLLAPAGAAPAPGRANQGTTWLSDQLVDGLLYTRYQGTDYPNHGTTLDAALAFEALGTRDGALASVLAVYDADPDQYVAPFGSTSAGGLGKLLTAVQQSGTDAADFAQGHLLQRLANTVSTGSDAGWAHDGGATDYSNTVTQSFAVRALALGGAAEARSAARFLLKQQCAEGYFRTYMVSEDNTCDGGTAAQSGASVDATAYAVLALKQVRHSEVPQVQNRVTHALRAAKSWLVGEQAAGGAFSDGGVKNTNSTGLAAQALSLLRKDGRAERSARWVLKHKVTGKVVKASKLTKADRGAIAYTFSDLRRAEKHGISNPTRFYWQSATAQAVPALGLLG